MNEEDKTPPRGPSHETIPSFQVFLAEAPRHCGTEISRHPVAFQISDSQDINKW